MDYIEQTESEIVVQLKQIESQYIKVHAAPESDEQRPEQSGVYSNLFVMYTGSRYSEPRSTNEVSQDEFFQFGVVIESPLLRDDHGIYSLKKKVSDALLGFIPSNSNRLTLVSSGYNAEKMEQNAGVFTFNMIFETRAMAVQALPLPEDWGVASKIELNVKSKDNSGYLTTEENEYLSTEENELITL